MQIRVFDATSNKVIGTYAGTTERGARLRASKAANIPFAWTTAVEVDDMPGLEAVSRSLGKLIGL